MNRITMVKIIEGLRMVSEGKSLKDKILISKYLFLKVPLHLIMRKLGAKKVNNNLQGNIILKTEDGVFFCGRNIFSVFTCSSIYEKDVTEEIKKLKEGVFIDVGANVGKYSIILGNKLKNRGKIIAIEPLHSNMEIIRKSIKLNNLNNIIFLEVACGSENKITDFYIDPTGAGGGGSSLIKPQKKKIKIKLRKLDNILKNLKIKKVDLIKIDVEGAETEVLKGTVKTLKKSHPKIIFEAWDKQYLKKVKKILDKFNYKIKKIAEENYLAY